MDINDTILFTFMIASLAMVVLVVITYWWNMKITAGIYDVHTELVKMNTKLEVIARTIPKQIKVEV